MITEHSAKSHYSVRLAQEGVRSLLPNRLPLAGDEASLTMRLPRLGLLLLDSLLPPSRCPFCLYPSDDDLLFLVYAVDDSFERDQTHPLVVGEHYPALRQEITPFHAVIIPDSHLAVTSAER